MTSLTLEPKLRLLRRLAFPSIYGEHLPSNAFACSGTRRVHESQSHKDLDPDVGYGRAHKDMSLRTMAQNDGIPGNSKGAI